MNDSIGPALSPEQWAEYLAHKNDPAWKPSPFTSGLGAAAMLFDGYQYFTWDDVAMLEDLDRLDLAGRIAALLPPKRG